MIWRKLKADLLLTTALIGMAVIMYCRGGDLDKDVMAADPIHERI